MVECLPAEEPFEQQIQRDCRACQRWGRVGGAGHLEAEFVERGEQHMAERVGAAGWEASLTLEVLELCLDHPQCVARVEGALRLPAHDRGRLEQRDAMDRRVHRQLQPGETSGSQPALGVGPGLGGRGDGRRDLGLDGVEGGFEQRLFAGEVVVEGGAADAGPLSASCRCWMLGVLPPFDALPVVGDLRGDTAIDDTTSRAESLDYLDLDAQLSPG